jgi:hypothetical protein
MAKASRTKLIAVTGDIRGVSAAGLRLDSSGISNKSMPMGACTASLSKVIPATSNSMAAAAG